MYILALIKRDDMSTEQVREFCTTELQDFLKEGALSPPKITSIDVGEGAHSWREHRDGTLYRAPF
jgi:hypothetical protein